MERDVLELIEKLLNNTSKYLVVEKEKAYIVDPVFSIVRNRVTAEYLKTIIRVYGAKRRDLIEKLVRFLLERQNPNGSWNEIHPNYDHESALVTSFVGEALILSLDYLDGVVRDKMISSLEKAKDFVLSKELEPGYFIKSTLYTADHLNVDATCGAFLVQYSTRFGDQQALESAKNAAKRVCQFQRKDGAFPYAVTKGSYPYVFNIPCIHYQGVTLYYLSKIYTTIQEEWLKDCMIKGLEWLSQVQREDGRFDWSKSGLMFAYYLSGAYAFAVASFMYGANWDRKYLKNAEKALLVLEKNILDIALRWEKGTWSSFLGDLIVAIRSANLGEYPPKHRIFRLGYAIYRQIGRRRFSTQVNDDLLFKLATRLVRIRTSTIEPSKNFPDMFMTSEILDCLSYASVLR